ncbi:hypothetical protein ACRYCC_19640 [Actinomadura scrupuli]|uniref:hypothetical protein n=1 Tax=Actinomadura scrupuli TaxID=559629 RepID=UPI003D9908FA
MISARLRGWTVAAGAAGSVLLVALVGLSGPSAAEPYIGPPTPAPPWFRPVHLPDPAVTVMLWTAAVLGCAAVVVGLRLVRAGRPPSPARLVAGGALAVAVLVVVPPVGSTDLMDYAAYGRITDTGHSPYTTTPYRLARSGDPVARLSSHAWRHKTSVYGPAGTAAQWLASRAAGASAARTVWWLKLENALAFLVVALALDRLTAANRARRARAHLLWTLNPLMLWAVVAGGHIDGLSAALAVAGLWALRAAGRRPLAAGFCGGLLLGAATAVKAPFALLAAGGAWSWRRSPRTLLMGAAGMLLAIVPGYLLAGGTAIESVVDRGRRMSRSSPWHLGSELAGGRPPAWVVTWGALLLALALAAVFARGLPAEPPEVPGVRLALAFSLAWLISSQVYYPWYETMVFSLLALMPASRADVLLVVRGGIAALGNIPGVSDRLRPAWLDGLVTHGVLPYLVPSGLLAVGLALVVMAARRTWTPDLPGPSVLGAPGPSGSGAPGTGPSGVNSHGSRAGARS